MRFGIDDILYITDDIRRWFHAKKGLTLFIVFVVFFLPVIICFWGGNPEQGSEQREVSEVCVNYQIQHGSVYTGDQTPVVYEGIETLEVNENGLGANGLPIMGFFPTHAKLSFILNNGDRYVLYIPVIDKSPVISLAMNSENSKNNRILFRTKIERRDSQIFIEAISLTREEWRQLNI